MYMAKIVLIGDGAVGKTAIKDRYLGKGFTSNYLMTIGADFARIDVQLEDPSPTIFTLQIWDLAGQPRFNTVRATYYMGTHAAILVFDVTRRATLESLNDWIDKVWKVVGHVPMIVFGNKVDLREDMPSISSEEGEEFAKEVANKSGVEVLYFDSSAKTGMNIEEAFQTIAENVFRNRGRRS